MNFDRKEHLQHRAVSLRQHGFLVVVYDLDQPSATWLIFYGVRTNDVMLFLLV